MEVLGDPSPVGVQVSFNGREVATNFSDPRNSTTVKQYLADIEANSCTPDAIAYVGQLLWTAVFNGPVLGLLESYHAFKATRHRGEAPRLRRHPRCCAIFREKLYISELGGSSLENRVVIVRDPPGGVFEAPKTASPARSTFVAARKAWPPPAERNNLQRRAERTPRWRNSGQVTPDRLLPGYLPVDVFTGIPQN